MKSWYYVIAFAAAAWLVAAGCGGKSDPRETAAPPAEEKAAGTAESERSRDTSGEDERGADTPLEANGPEAWFPPENPYGPRHPVNPNIKLVSAAELLVPIKGGKRAENVVAFDADVDGRVNGPRLALASVDGKYWADLGVEGYWPEFSPDGTKIAYAGPEGLCVVNADGSGKTVLSRGVHSLTGYARSRCFAFSPDGRAVVYTASKGESTHGIFIADVAGRGRRLIYSSDEYLGSPSLPASGKEIAFQKSRDSYRGKDIYVINVDGSGLRRVTGPPKGNERWLDENPTFSPDGSKIAFRSGDWGAAEHDMAFDAYVVNADGTGRRNLTADDRRDDQPYFSRDGKRIVFYSWDGGVTVADVNTSELRRVPTTAGGGLRISLTPRFSPDDRKIAYDPAAGATAERQIYIIDADGTGDTWLSPGGRVWYEHPCFSPMRVDGVLLDTYGRVIEE